MMGLCGAIARRNACRARAGRVGALRGVASTRPALANGHVQCIGVGHVVLKLKTMWCAGSNRIVMSRLEFRSLSAWPR